VIGGAPAEDAVVLGEHKTQLGDSAAQARGLFYQINFQSGVSQVEGGPHPPNAAAHNQGGGWFASGNPDRRGRHEYLYSVYSIGNRNS
jgi:hypothetical protein